ncbi:hypothetical protein ACVLD2_004268 [Paenibacillus sp. PvR052]
MKESAGTAAKSILVEEENPFAAMRRAAYMQK